MSKLDQFDSYLNSNGPAALVLRQQMMPAEGNDGVVFPATFASGDGFKGGYNIDRFNKDDPATNVCLIDSVGSQANRIEPIFGEEKYEHLIPQISVTAGDHTISILEAGHRAGDALVRCSELQQELHDAFISILNGDAVPMAKISPTSIVFGVWDSRDTQAKLPRLVSSTIRAFNVRELTRGAVYAPPVNYSELEVFTEKEKEKAEGDKKSPLAKRGFVHIPASRSHGGVLADGGIRREATLQLAALRQVFSGSDSNRTLKLRRYILGLALVAFTHNPSGYLRQGCLLVLDPDKLGDNEFVEVHPNGQRKPIELSHDDAITFATVAAKDFGVGESRVVPFDKKRAAGDVKKKD